MSCLKENQVIGYDDFKLVIKEQVSETCFIVDLIYNSEEYFDTLP